MSKTKGDYIEGRDIMLFVNGGATESTPTWVKTAAATSHTISYSGETKERVTKDTENGAFCVKGVILSHSLQAFRGVCCFG